MPFKSLKQLGGRKFNIYIRYKERADMDFDYIRVYPGILKYVLSLIDAVFHVHHSSLELMMVLK